MSAFKDWVEQRDNDIRKKLIENYMAECPFIEFFEIKDIEREGATINIAFDEEYQI
jgi:hypothetical protein